VALSSQPTSKQQQHAVSPYGMYVCILLLVCACVCVCVLFTHSGCSRPAPPVPDASSCVAFSTIHELCTNSIRYSEACVNALGGDVATQFIAACILDGCFVESPYSSLNACLMIGQFYDQCSLHGVSTRCSDWQALGCGELQQQQQLIIIVKQRNMSTNSRRSVCIGQLSSISNTATIKVYY